MYVYLKWNKNYNKHLIETTNIKLKIIIFQLAVKATCLICIYFNLVWATKITQTEIKMNESHSLYT